MGFAYSAAANLLLYPTDLVYCRSHATQMHAQNFGNKIYGALGQKLTPTKCTRENMIYLKFVMYTL